MRNLTIGLGIIVILAIVLGNSCTEASSAEPGPLELLEGFQKAKGKLKSLDTQLGNLAESIGGGPEGRKAYEFLKKKGKALLKKGINFFKKKVASDMKKKREIEMRSVD